MKTLIKLMFLLFFTLAIQGCATASLHHAKTQTAKSGTRSIAALPPYWSTVNEFKAVLDSEEVKKGLRSQVIRSIKVNSDYTWTVLSDLCRVDVNTEYKRPVDVGYLAGAATFEATVESSKCKN